MKMLTLGLVIVMGASSSVRAESLLDVPSSQDANLKYCPPGSHAVPIYGAYGDRIIGYRCVPNQKN